MTLQEGPRGRVSEGRQRSQPGRGSRHQPRRPRGRCCRKQDPGWLQRLQGSPRGQG